MKRLDIIDKVIIGIMLLLIVSSVVSGITGYVNSRMLLKLDRELIQIQSKSDSLVRVNEGLKLQDQELIRVINAQDEELNTLNDPDKIELRNEKIHQKHRTMPFDSALFIFESQHGKAVLQPTGGSR